jgi:hypothetical protein
VNGAPEFPLRRSGEGIVVEAACAVVLVRVAETQFHLGLRRGSESHEPVLHLAWHRRLRDQALNQIIKNKQRILPSAVIALSLDPSINEALQVLAGRVTARYANNASIAYGSGEVTATFERETGELMEPDAAFTCATFVLAMLRSVGVSIIDCERWRAPTEEDRQWQRETGKRLLEWIAEQYHGDLPRAKERIENDLGSRRYRPTDVAGAALFGRDKWPVGSEEVEPRASELELALAWPSPSA